MNEAAMMFLDDIIIIRSTAEEEISCSTLETSMTMVYARPRAINAAYEGANAHLDLSDQLKVGVS